MKQQLLYIHGGTAFSVYENYLEHLRTKELDPLAEKTKRWTTALFDGLKEGGWEVFAPSMPNSNNAKYEEWKIWFERHFDFIRDDITLVGWSQGAYFLAKYLSENTFPFKIKKLLLVAAPFESADFGLEDGGDFAFNPQDLTNMAAQVSAIHILHSKDDFVVPYAHAEKYAEHLPKAQLHTFEDYNHFLIESFPEISALIEENT